MQTNSQIPSPQPLGVGKDGATSYNESSYSNFSRPLRREEFKAYVKNVPTYMTKESLDAYFRSCGNVTSVNIMEPKEGRNSTIGFVAFSSEEEVNNAIQTLNGTFLEDHCLTVERAIPRDRNAGTPRRDKDNLYQRKADFQHSVGYQNRQPSFQGNRTEHSDQPGGMGHYEQPGSRGHYEQPGGSGHYQQPRGMGHYEQPGSSAHYRQPEGREYYDQPAGSGHYQQPGFNGHYEQCGGSGHYEQRGGSGHYEQPGGSGHYQQPRGRGYYEQRGGSGHYEQRGGSGHYEQRGGSGHYEQPGGMGHYEQPGGSGHYEQRGGSGHYEQPGGSGYYGQPGGMGHYEQPGGRGAGLEQQSYGQQSAVMMSPYKNMGVKVEQATFNPRGPGRGVGIMHSNGPSPGPGSYVNGTTNDYSSDTQALQTNAEQQQLWDETSSVDTQQVTGRLPHSTMSQDNFTNLVPQAQMPQVQNGGHFARECPNQGESGGRGSGNKAAPVTYIPPELPSNMDELFQDAPHSGLNFDKYDDIPVRVTGKDPVPPISTFEQAGILEQCLKNIGRAQFTKPTPIQKYAIPIALGGRDLMACAQTGSGKTVAFLVPVLTAIIKQDQLSSGYLTGETPAPSALCIAPTRELAVQIYKEVLKFSDGTVVSPAVCYGGVSVQHQLNKIRRGCHFLVATPGRLDDFVSRKQLSLEKVRYLILDEADRMLDMGFEGAVRKLVETCGMPGKAHRQTLMFSATFPDEIQRLAADFLKEDYLFVIVGRIGGSNLDISQTIVSVPGDDKQDKLFNILLNSGTDRTLIFVELKRVADFLACLLSQNNFPTTSISGDRTQQEREAALQDFRSGRAPVLVATSVAARGLDIPDVKHVINFDLPQDIEEYVHRIGRTGRIGNKGRATSFFQPGKDDKLARSLVKVLSEAYQEVPDWLEQVAEEAIGSSYGPASGKFASRDTREREHSRGSGSTDVMGDVKRRMEHLNVQEQTRPPPGPVNSSRDHSGYPDEEEWD